ncbi:MAG: sugar ABC transporter permease [Clostridia bacterium]|nr:sugar ABC transporter permease [Clostridia bacterium]MBQ5770144.1 sugar ABC transporter permease [Clostridia bacterium]
MKKYTDLEYLKLPKLKRFLVRITSGVCSIPAKIFGLILKLFSLVKTLFTSICKEAADIFLTFKNGDWKTRLSFVVMGFGSFARGQILRGILFLGFEIVFIGYMILAGGHWLSLITTLGKTGPSSVYDPILDVFTPVYNDNSFKILLYSVLTLFFIVAFLFTWRVNVKQNKIAQQILASGKKLKSSKDDLRSMVDDQFHKTLLALPLTGIIIFTVLPIFFMILVAFTNFDGSHNGYTNNLFTWVGLDNFNTMLSWTANSQGSVQSYSATFGEVLTWTLIWAFFATFTNYFLGMFIAMAINKKGIRLKKLWRTILVLTIAIPQFISLLYVSKMFAKNGIINGFLMNMGWIDKALPFWEEASWARVSVILINIWIGIPYLMLITTGILMNIPQDLYESARIDGANAWQQYRKITLPYMLFVTGPYLLTSFTGNMNNFNVIFLLTGGAPTNPAASSAAGSVGYTDLLVTWLFKITTGAEAAYNIASVIGILVFVAVAVISLVVYNLLPSIKNEEDFQ